MGEDEIKQNMVKAMEQLDAATAHRQFESGANRDSDLGKLDFEGFLSPIVLERYSQYLNGHRKLPDGTLRDSDNWQKGMTTTVYMKSGLRHVFDVWAAHRGYRIFNPKTEEPIDIEDAICAIIFNFSGYLLELLHERLKNTTFEVDVASTTPGDEPIITYGKAGESDNLNTRQPEVEKGPLVLDEDYLRGSEDDEESYQPESGNIKRGTE